jgi:hypothetical protein
LEQITCGMIIVVYCGEVPTGKYKDVIKDVF